MILDDSGRRYGLFDVYDADDIRIAKEMTTVELVEAGIMAPGVSPGALADDRRSYHGMRIERVAELTINQYRAHNLRKRGHKIPDYVVPWLHCYRQGNDQSGFSLEGLVYFCGLRKLYYDVYLKTKRRDYSGGRHEIAAADCDCHLHFGSGKGGNGG